MAQKIWGLLIVIAAIVAVVLSSSPTDASPPVVAPALDSNSPIARAPLAPVADQVFNDDSIVVGSMCVGLDCSTGENFNFDTIRLKENNLRIKFDDTSASAAFPSNDWTIVANDSSNGGKNYLAFEDSTAGTIPFLVEAGSGNHALYVDGQGDVGVGTNAPVVELHVEDGDTPTLRLEQDNSVGWGTQTWDVAGNESNFFIRDVSNDSNLTFRIFPNTKADTLVLKSGRVGIGTDGPAKSIHIAESSGIDPTIRLGQGNSDRWDIEGGETVFALTDAANSKTPVKVTAGAKENALFINSSGEIGFGTASPAKTVHVNSNASVVPTIRLAENGTDLWDINGGPSDFSLSDVANSTTPLKITAAAPDDSIFVDASGNVGIGTNNPTAVLYVDGSTHVNGSFTRSSDRRLKENIIAVNNTEILNQLLNTPIYYWNYTADLSNTTHLGPMAQDFNSESSLGTDTTIDTLDLTGALIASVQALNAELELKEADLEALQAENDDLEARLEALEASIAQLLAAQSETEAGE